MKKDSHSRKKPVSQENTASPASSPEEERKIERRRRWMNVITVVGILLAILLSIWGWRAGLFTDKEVLQRFLEKAGWLAPIVFLLIQVIQCVIPIIPGGVSLLIGVMVFGPLEGFLLNYVGIYLGSLAAFLLARYYGRIFVRSLVSEQSYRKYTDMLEKNQERFNHFFIIAMALPGMPDDLICMIAGLSDMNLKYFCFHLAWTKIPTILLYTVFLDKASDGVLFLFRRFLQ